MRIPSSRFVPWLFALALLFAAQTAARYFRERQERFVLDVTARSTSPLQYQTRLSTLLPGIDVRPDGFTLIVGPNSSVGSAPETCARVADLRQISGDLAEILVMSKSSSAMTRCPSGELAARSGTHESVSENPTWFGWALVRGDSARVVYSSAEAVTSERLRSILNVFGEGAGTDVD